MRIKFSHKIIFGKISGFDLGTLYRIRVSMMDDLAYRQISIKKKLRVVWGCGLVSEVGKDQRLFRRDYNYRTEHPRPSPMPVPSPAPVGLAPLGMMQ